MLRFQKAQHTTGYWLLGALVAGAVTTEAIAVEPAVEGVTLNFSDWQANLVLKPEKNPAAAWESESQSLGTEYSLLTPGTGLPKLDSSFHLTRSLGKGVEFDVGANKYRASPQLETGRREYFLGLTYGDFDSGVWYTNDEMLDGRVARLEAGWTHDVEDDLSISLRMGRTEFGSDSQLSGSTNLSFGAQKKFGRLGLGLRLIDRGVMNTPDVGRLHLFGTLSADLP